MTNSYPFNRLGILMMLSLCFTSALAAQNLEIVEVVSVDDLDKITVRWERHERAVGLAGVLPISEWPKALSADDQQIRAEILAKAKLALVGRRFFVQADALSDNVKFPRVEFTMHMTEKPGSPLWDPSIPSHQAGWGMFDANLSFIEQGLTPYVPAAVEIPAFPRSGAPFDGLARAAQSLAEREKRGIYRDVDLSEKLKRIAGPPPTNSTSANGPPPGAAQNNQIASPDVVQPRLVVEPGRSIALQVLGAACLAAIAVFLIARRRPTR